MFHSVECKLGNMRKNQRWTVYPAAEDAVFATIQCENRIAKVELATGKTILSSGKGGHQGHIMLSQLMGAIDTTCPADVLVQLREIVAKMNGTIVTVVGIAKG